MKNSFDYALYQFKKDRKKLLKCLSYDFLKKHSYSLWDIHFIKFYTRMLLRILRK